MAGPDEPLRGMSAELLSHIEQLGGGADYADQIYALVGRSPFVAQSASQR